MQANAWSGAASSSSTLQPPSPLLLPRPDPSSKLPIPPPQPQRGIRPAAAHSFLEDEHAPHRSQGGAASSASTVPPPTPPQQSEPTGISAPSIVVPSSPDAQRVTPPQHIPPIVSPLAFPAGVPSLHTNCTKNIGGADLPHTAAVTEMHCSRFGERGIQTRGKDVIEKRVPPDPVLPELEPLASQSNLPRELVSVKIASSASFLNTHIQTEAPPGTKSLPAVQNAFSVDKSAIQGPPTAIPIPARLSSAATSIVPKEVPESMHSAAQKDIPAAIDSEANNARSRDVPDSREPAAKRARKKISKRWTGEEIAILRTCLQSAGETPLRFVAKALVPKLPGRSEKAIEKRLKVDGSNMLPSPPREVIDRATVGDRAAEDRGMQAKTLVTADDENDTSAFANVGNSNSCTPIPEPDGGNTPQALAVQRNAQSKIVANTPRTNLPKTTAPTEKKSPENAQAAQKRQEVVADIPLLPEFPCDTATCRKGGPWTREEDIIVARLQREIGDDWEKISAILGTRTARGVENRWSNPGSAARKEAIAEAMKFVENDAANDAVNDVTRKSSRRENIALRWALVRASQEKTNEDSDASYRRGARRFLEKLPVDPGDSIQTPGKESEGIADESQDKNVVVQALLRTRMASAWSSTGNSQLPLDFMPKTSQIPLPGAEEAARPVTLLLDFLCETINSGFPMKYEDARLSVAVLTQSGLLPILSAESASNAIVISGPRIVHRLQALFENLIRHDGDIQWASLLGEELLSPLLSWTLDDPSGHARVAFRNALLEACCVVVEECGKLLLDGSPSEYSAAHEVTMAVVNCDPEIMAALKPEVRETLASGSSLFKMISAMNISMDDALPGVVSAAGEQLQTENHSNLLLRLIPPDLDISPQVHQADPQGLSLPGAKSPIQKATNVSKKPAKPSGAGRKTISKTRKKPLPRPQSVANLQAAPIVQKGFRKITNIGSFT